MAREAAEEARQGTPQRQPADGRLNRAQGGDELEQREPQNEGAHDELDRRDLRAATQEGPGGERRSTRERSQDDRATERGDDGGNPESEHHVARCPAREEAHLEEIVGRVHDGGGRHRHLDREEQGEHRHEERAQAEAREERQQRHPEGGDSQDDRRSHGASPPVAWLGQESARQSVRSAALSSQATKSPARREPLD
jgi:hypothetical protein